MQFRTSWFFTTVWFIQTWNKVVCCSVSRVQLFVTPWTVARQATLSFISSQSLLKLMSIVSMMLSVSSSIATFSSFPSIRVFSTDSALRIRWPKDWSFSFNINPSNEYSGLISFRMNWFDLLAVPGTFKSLLQHHSFKASILQRSSLFYGPTLMSIHDYWKNHSFDYTDLWRQSDIPAFFF